MVAKSFPRKQILTNHFHETFLVENSYGCKIISSKTGSYQKFSWKILVENFLWLQNHFLENRFLPKIFINIFCVKFLWLQNHFLENWFLENFHENGLWVENHFLENRLQINIFMILFLVENVLCLQNHFLENRFLAKIFMKLFWSKIFYGCKIISSKTGS